MATLDSTLYLTPDNDVAHDHIAHTIAAARQDTLFAPTLILVPTAAAGSLLTARLGQGFNLRIGAFGQLAGRLLAFAEESLNAQGDHRAYIAGPDRNLEFSIIRSDDYAITDAVFASDGSLLVLERRYGFSVGVGMRIRRFDAGSIAPGTRLEGTTLIEAGLTNRIDNMEGIGFYRDATGRDRIVLVSDDNFSRFQETLVLEFEIVP